MKKKYLKIIVAVWAFFVSVDQVVAFVATLDGSFDWSNPIPYFALILFIAALIIFIPGMQKLDKLLIALISVLFLFFAVTTAISFVKSVPSILDGSNKIAVFIACLTSILKDMFFNIVPAVLGIVYLADKHK